MTVLCLGKVNLLLLFSPTPPSPPLPPVTLPSLSTRIPSLSHFSVFSNTTTIFPIPSKHLHAKHPRKSELSKIILDLALTPC